MARRRASYEIDQRSQAHEAQMQQAQQQIEAQQRQIESLKQQKQNERVQPAHQEDLTQKLQEYGNLKQQGLITEDEFQKLKADLLSKI